MGEWRERVLSSLSSPERVWEWRLYQPKKKFVKSTPSRSTLLFPLHYGSGGLRQWGEDEKITSNRRTPSIEGGNPARHMMPQISQRNFVKPTNLQLRSPSYLWRTKLKFRSPPKDRTSSLPQFFVKTDERRKENFVKLTHFIAGGPWNFKP